MAQFMRIIIGEVKRKLEETRKMLGTANNGKLSEKKAGKVTDISKRWLAETAITLKESSFNKYEDILRCYIIPEFGENEFSEITNRHMIDFVNRLCTSGGARKQGLSPSTASEVLSVMNRVRVYALQQDYTVSFSPDCINLKQRQHNIRVFSLEEEKCFLHTFRII